MLKFVKPTVVIITVVFGTLIFIVFLQQFGKKHTGNELTNANMNTLNNIILSDLNIPRLGSSSKAVPNFSKYSDVIEKKRAFFAYLQPEIQRQNEIVLNERQAVLALQEVFKRRQNFSKEQQNVFDRIAAKYYFTGDKPQTLEQVLETLIRRVDTIPVALVLVQAANESGWGTSRFAKKGYNFFGLWCFKEGCGFVPKQRNEDSVHEVAKFKDLSHAVMTYVRNLNRHYAYKELRVIRQNLRQSDKPVTANSLALGLSSYSERGQEYIDELLSMLRVNTKHMDIAG